MAAANSSKVYFIGGSDGTNYKDTVWEYTPNDTSWMVKTSLPVTLSWAKTAVYQDSLIYVLGGSDGTNPVSTVYLYNTIDNTWRICTPMPGAAYGGVAGIVKNKLVWTSGANSISTLTATYVGTINEIDHSNISWSTGIDIPTPVFKTDGGSWGPDEIIVATGTNELNWSPINPNPCYAYNPETYTWRQLPFKTTPTLGGYTASFLFSSTPSTQTWKIVSASGYDGIDVVGSAITEIYTEVFSVVGITNNIISKFSIYPNPAKNILNVVSDKIINNIKIYNIFGKLVYNENIKDFKTEINTSLYSNGMYLMQIETKDGISVQKFNVTK